MSHAAPTLRRVALVIAALVASGCGRQTSSGLPDFTGIVEKSSPSVVNISTIAAPSLDDGRLAPGGDGAPDFYPRFLDDREPPGPDPDPGDDEDPQDDDQEAAPDAPRSLGSGFVLWADGYILTNAHVVEGAREIIVRLADRRQMTATLVGVDERSDLALLKIEATGLPAAPLGNSKKLRPGEWVLAIGSPFGFDHSVTAGIVSATDRSLPTEQYVPFIQSDVAINPGNSGGPLFNLAGEVVGVNSQIFSQSGGFQGVSFSIPIDVAAKVAKQLRDKGKVARGWLGVVVQEVDRNLAQSFHMDKPEGALVARVLPGSPAEQAGIKAGDVILTFNGDTIGTSSALPPMVGSMDPGEMVNLEVVRDGKKVTFKLPVGPLEDDAPGDSGSDNAPPSEDTPIPGGIPAPLGLVVSPLTDEQRSTFRVLSGGALVQDVRPGPALAAGIRPGDVVLSIAGQEIDSPERLSDVAKRLTPGATVPILVSRNGSPQFLPLDLSRSPSD